MDDNIVNATTGRVLDRKPPFLRTIIGLFYGANATSRSFVPVPIALGVKEHRHIDDLATEVWISRTSASVDPLFRGRLRISHFPQLEDCKLLNDYTVFFENQSGAVNPNRLLTYTSEHSFWWGDVLVMKHRGKEEEVVDIGEQDVALVDLLVTWTWEADNLEDSE